METVSIIVFTDSRNPFLNHWSPWMRCEMLSCTTSSQSCKTGFHSSIYPAKWERFRTLVESNRASAQKYSQHLSKISTLLLCITVVFMPFKLKWSLTHRPLIPGQPTSPFAMKWPAVSLLSPWLLGPAWYFPSRMVARRMDMYDKVMRKPGNPSQWDRLLAGLPTPHPGRSLKDKTGETSEDDWEVEFFCLFETWLAVVRIFQMLVGRPVLRNVCSG